MKERIKDSLQNLYEQMGEKRFAIKCLNLIDDGKVNTDNFSLKALWEAMGKPQLRAAGLVESRQYGEDEEIFEALDSSAFPKITGALISKTVQEAYDKEYGVGDNLVSKIPSSVREETMVGFGEDDALQEVPEGMSYQEGSITEKYHLIRNRKFGRIISLTEEMVKFDQTGQMVLRAQRVGEAGKAKHERIIMDAILEVNTTGRYASWRPNGTATGLYSSSSNDPYSDGTLDNLGSITLADETDIGEALTLAAQFVDENGDPMNWVAKDLLTSMALDGIARQIVYSGQAVKLTTPAGTLQPYGGMTPYMSSYIDQLKAGTAWWIGDFKKQFIMTQVFPLQVFQAKAGSEQEFERDVIFRFKVRLMEGCGAVTNRYVIKANA